MKNLARLLALSLLLLAVQPASAFYDPSAQRWINRDPIVEPSSQLLRQLSNDVNDVKSDVQNLHAFVGNNAVSSFDPFGLDCYRIGLPGPTMDDQGTGKTHRHCYRCVDPKTLTVVFQQCFAIRDTGPMNPKAFKKCDEPLEAFFAINCIQMRIGPLASIVRRLQNCFDHHY